MATIQMRGGRQAGRQADRQGNCSRKHKNRKEAAKNFEEKTENPNGF